MAMIPSQKEVDLYPYDEVAKGVKNQTYKKQLQDIQAVLDTIPNNKKRKLYLVSAERGQYLENVSSTGFSCAYIKSSNSHVFIESAILSPTLNNNHWFVSDNGTVSDLAENTNGSDMILYQG